MKNNRSDYSYNNSSLGNNNFFNNNNTNSASASSTSQVNFSNNNSNSNDNNNSQPQNQYQCQNRYQQQHHYQNQHQQQQHRLFNNHHNYHRDNNRATLHHNFSSNYNHHHKNNNNIGDESNINKNDQETRQDVIFRKVRGILNKITPETFDKLSNDLANVGLDSPKTLRGVIYLVFDKALKDLKYSSLYAKLCQELSEKVPNFEQNKSGPNTFCKFLISKCEDEFARRRKATEDFDNKLNLTDEEYELRAIAKQKMLGNIKFICELGKKRLLQEEILHECIRELLSKKKERSLQDQAQDLECLCQIMRTIGSLLDVQASKNLMNQYFERINLYSEKQELPSRIRFMLRDVIDLRKNNWKLRPFQREDNAPQTLSKLREDARGFEPNLNIVASGLSGGTSIDKFGNNKNLGVGDLSKLSKGKLSMLIDDEPSFTTTTDFHWGQSSFLPFDDPFNSDFGSTNTKTAMNNRSTSDNNSNDLNKSKPSFAQFNTMSSQSGSSKPRSPIEVENIAPIKKVNPGQNLYRPPISQNANQPNNIRDFPNNRNFRPVTNRYQPPQASHSPNMTSNNLPPATEPLKVVRPQPKSPPPASGRSNNDFRDRTSQPLHSLEHNHPHPDFRHRDRNPRSFDMMNRGPGNGYNREFHKSPPRQINIRRPIDHTSEPPFNQSQQPQSQKAQQFLPQQQQSLQLKPNRYTPPNQLQNVSQNYISSEQSPQMINNGPPRHFNTRNASQQQPQPQNDFSSHRREPMGQGRSFNSFRSNRGQYNNHYNANNSGFNHSRHQLSPGPPPGDLHLNSPSWSSTNYSNNNRHFNNFNTNNNPNKQDSYRRPLHQSPPQQNIVQPQQAVKPSGILDVDDSSTETITPIAPPGQAPMKLNSIRQPPISSGGFDQAKPRADSFDREKNLHQPNQQIATDTTRLPLRANPSSNIPPKFTGKSNYTHNLDRPRQHQQQMESRSRDANSKPFFETRPHQGGLDRRPNFQQSPPRFMNNNLRKTPIQNQQTSNENNKSNNIGPASKEIPVDTKPLFLAKPIVGNRVNDVNFSLRPAYKMPGRQSEVSNGNKASSGCVDDKPRLKSESEDDCNSKTKQTGITSSSSTSPNKPEQKLDSKTTQITPQNNNIYIDKFDSILDDSFKNSANSWSHSSICTRIKELKIPKNSQQDCLVSAIKKFVTKSDSDRENFGKLLTVLIPSVFDQSNLIGAFSRTFDHLNSLEIETPRVKSVIAGILSQAVFNSVISFEDVGNLLKGGKHHPLFLLFLQKLDQSAGQAWLNDRYLSSKINLMSMLPEVDQTRDRLANVLKDRNLGYLDPMLTIEPDLWQHMKEKDATPAGLYRWVKDNVHSTIQESPSFAHVLVSCLLRYIHETASSVAAQSNAQNNEVKSISSKSSETKTGPLDADADDSGESSKSTPTASSGTQAVSNELEKEYLTKYQQILHALLKDKQMQLATLYSLQSFYFKLDFPKGSLLRWFDMLYDLNIIDEDVFFTWKEEINDEFPGKGQALFQVNTWLNWLAEAESEDEEDDDN